VKSARNESSLIFAFIEAAKQVGDKPERKNLMATA
jgi:hypothetical protein